MPVCLRVQPSFSRSPRYILILALVSGLILLVGSLVRPHDETTKAVSPSSEADLARLARLSERRSLESMTGFFASVASDADASLVRLRDARTSAIVWDRDLVVAARLTGPFPADVVLTAADGEHRVPVVLRGPQLPLVALTPPASPALVPIRRSVAPISSGDWIVGVWKGDGARGFVPGNALDTTTTACHDLVVRQVVTSFALTPTMAGGGILDFDGNLLAVVLPCGDRMVAIAADSIDTMLGSRDTLEDRLLSRYGVRVGSLSGDEAAYFKTTEGALVREVWTRYAADVAGLRPGDLIRAIGGAPVTGADDLQALATALAGEPVPLSIARGTARVEIQIATRDLAAAPAAPEPGVGLVWGSAQGFRIESVAAGSPAARAGIRPGDRLIRIDRVVPASLTQVQRLIGGQSSKAAFVEIERDGRRFGVLLS
jgi:membrane-associated protease RseP (regulator of RpoE activity)